MTSAASSGGVRSRVVLIAETIAVTDSSNAARTSSLVTTWVRGNPVTMSRPPTSAVSSSASGHAEPSWSFTSSAVFSPISRPNSFLNIATIASFNSSPATRAECAVTIPPIEITATSVVPPPISTMRFALGKCTGNPAPIAAAIGSSMMYTGRRAPANSAASCTARFSTPVISDGTQIIIRGLFHLLVCTF